MRIALDAMGGDQGPEVVVAGAAEAVEADPNIKVVLVGDEDQVGSLVPDDAVDAMEVVHASEVIGMSESPAVAVRKKKDSSICSRYATR